MASYIREVYTTQRVTRCGRSRPVHFADVSRLLVLTVAHPRHELLVVESTLRVAADKACAKLGEVLVWHDDIQPIENHPQILRRDRPSGSHVSMLHLYPDILELLADLPQHNLNEIARVHIGSMSGRC